jgi:hypothetical protein
VTIDFNNAKVTSTLTGNKAAIVTGSDLGTDTTIYQWGSIKNLKLIGPGSGSAGTVGIWIGGDPNGVYAPVGVDDYVDSFTNINIQGFDSGMESGKAYQDAFTSVSLSGNDKGFQVQGIFGSENMNMFGMQILNNGHYGFYAPNMPASEFTCTACSIDYNGAGAIGTAGIYVMNGTLNLIGGHMEQCGGYFIDGPVTLSAANLINIIGVTFVSIGGATPSPGGCPGFATPDPGYIHITGNNSHLNIGTGIELVRNHTVTSFINWEATGGANDLHVAPYMDPGYNPAIQAIPTSQAVNIASLDIPLFDQYVSSNHYFRGITVGQTVGGGFPGAGSIFAPGFVGTSINQGGTIPSIATFPFSGGYMGFNSTNLGDVDF